ncbi:MAG: ABC transporter permease [Gammaproteobacteria bacterium]|nr:ABC transporter permease [Gammaproteobacteria bacterium]
MWTHKMRSILALFGILWGTLTVILLLALGNGFYVASQKDMMELADGTFFIRPAVTSKNFQGFPKGRKVKVKASFVMDLRRAISAIQLASPISVQSTNMSHLGKQTNAQAYGVSEDFSEMRKIKLMQGSRFINLLDTKDAARVVVLGDKLKTTLFQNAQALGQTIRIDNVPFIVIGIIQKSSKSVYSFYENNAIVPYTTAIALWGNNDIPYFIVHPASIDNLPQVEADIRSYLAQKLHFDKTDPSALRVFNTTKMFRFFTWFFFGIQLFLGICGALTLGVGSLGVANIMFLIVTERTKEIGLRKAIGARTWDILAQVLLEALMLVGAGGVLGFVLAWFIVTILQWITLPEWLGVPTLSMTVFIVTITILAVLGLLAGYFPARRAAKMDPVDALNFK